jgi:hypothetical protein
MKVLIGTGPWRLSRLVNIRFSKFRSLLKCESLELSEAGFYNQPLPVYGY